jgi:hypothetical protein
VSVMLFGSSSWALPARVNADPICVCARACVRACVSEQATTTTTSSADIKQVVTYPPPPAANGSSLQKWERAE